VVVVGLQLELRQIPYVLGAMVGVGHAAQRDGLALSVRRGAGRRRREGCGCRARAWLHRDLAWGIADGDGGRHRAARQIHHRDVVGAFVGHVGGPAISTRHGPVRGFAHGDGAGQRIVRRVKDTELTHAVRPARLSVPLWGWATGTSPITRSVAVSMTSARFEPQPRTSTRRPSPETARPWGFAPTSMLAPTRSVAVSMTLTVEAPSLLT